MPTIPATVLISEVEPSAERVRVDEVRPGDLVFDTFGGTHVVTSVRLYKRIVRIYRADHWDSSFLRTETITIIRGGDR